jgi:DNA helicase-2/ATP-dependent DNA helicase PcrA
MVGDEDQSIYGFRAAYPEALLSFEKDHPGARVLLMEENFRSCAQIVEAADRFIQKNILRHEKHMKAARAAGEEIEQIPLNDRKAQYDYLVRMAERCQAQTAVLYRNHENVLPLVDQLERKGIPYRLRNAEMTFFTHRVVADIRNIIAFAMNPRDTAVFLQIYYKIATYIRKQDALRICEISERENRDIMEIALRGGQLPDRTVQSCRLIRMHLKCLLTERADRAIARIVYNMGYGDYLERMEIGDSKVFILKMIGQGENSPGRFVERLDELRAIMEGRMKGGQEEASAVYRNGMQDIQPVILSTIHSSKGLEYDNVYLLDVIDGIFPESVPTNAKSMDEKERESYEEERRLFYVGVTRAKDRLSVFRLDQKSSLCEELVGRKKKAVQKMRRALAQERGNAAAERPFIQEEYEKYAAQIGEGLIIRHRKFGEGVVVEVQGELVVMQFGGMQKTLGMRVLYEKDLLIL